MSGSGGALSVPVLPGVGLDSSSVPSFRTESGFDSKLSIVNMSAVEACLLTEQLAVSLTIVQKFPVNGPLIKDSVIGSAADSKSAFERCSAAHHKPCVY